MDRMMRLFLLSLVIALAACSRGTPSEPEAPAVTAKPPADLCRRLEEGLEKLRARGALDYDKSGQATVEERIWLELGAEGRERFASSLGLLASCASPRGLAEQRVVVRNHWGMVVMQRTIDTRLDAGSLLAE
jgi:hypothetical protein